MGSWFVGARTSAEVCVDAKFSVREIYPGVRCTARGIPPSLLGFSTTLLPSSASFSAAVSVLHPLPPPTFCFVKNTLFVASPVSIPSPQYALGSRVAISLLAHQKRRSFQACVRKRWTTCSAVCGPPIFSGAVRCLWSVPRRIFV